MNVIDRYTRKNEISDHCPFNIMIECREHAGNPIPALPERCSRCGWNPAEAKRRKEVKNNAEASEAEND